MANVQTADYAQQLLLEKRQNFAAEGAHPKADLPSQSLSHSALAPHEFQAGSQHISLPASTSTQQKANWPSQETENRLSSENPVFHLPAPIIPYRGMVIAKLPKFNGNRPEVWVPFLAIYRH